MNKKSVVRFVIRCLLGMLFLCQVRTSIQAYNLRQTVMVTSTEYRKNFTFPSFTFCPFDESRSRTNNLTADYETIEQGHDPIYAIRQGFLNKPQFMNSFFIANITSPDLVHSFTRHSFGVFNKVVRCITYDPPEVSKSGRDNAVLFMFNMTSLSRILVVVHNRGMHLHSSTNFHGNYQFKFAPRTDGSGNHSIIRITDYVLETSFQEKLSGKHQCDNDYYKGGVNEKKTLENCYEKYIKSQMKCNLPWSNDNETKWDLNCDTPSDYFQLKEVFDSFDSLTLLELQQNTLCYPPCGIEEHKILKIGERDIATYMPVSETKSLFGITAQYKTSAYVTSKEALIYDFKDIIADFGGFLGLLLGFSILNLFDLMLEVAEKIFVSRMR